MNKQAKGLCGVDIGAKIAHPASRGGTWNRELCLWEGIEHYERESEILMITHKKSGDVRIRTTYGGDLLFQSNEWVVVTRD